MSEAPTIDAFEKNLRTEFRVLRAERKAVTLDLVSVNKGQCTSTQEQFSLAFEASADDVLGQGCFRLEHDQMGVFELFLVPIGRDRGQIRYEAVFDRFRKSPTN
jgi:hypothetical protein